MAWGRLALIHAAGEAEQVLPEIAACFGYQPPVQQQKITQPPPIDYAALPEAGNEQVTGNQPTVAEVPPARFLRLRRMVRKQQEDERNLDYLNDPEWCFTERDRRQEGTYRFDRPTPLLPMSRLTPFLLNGLGLQQAGIRLDHRQLSKRMAKGLAIQKLPFLLRQRWSQRLLILVDVHKRLEPYWSDFEFIVLKLRQQLGNEVVQVLRFDESYRGHELQVVSWPETSGHWQCWQPPSSNVSVLILGDLGAGDVSGGSRAFWLRVAQRLNGHPAPVVTLNPLAASSADMRTNRQFQPSPLNDQWSLPRYPLRNGFGVAPVDIDQAEIFACLSVLPVVDTGLLRKLRKTLGWGNSAMEGWLWNHRDIQQTGLGVRLRAAVTAKYQRLYQEKLAGTATAERLWAVVEEHHRNAFQGLKRLVQANRCVVERQQSAEVQDYLQRLAASISQGTEGSGQKLALLQQARTILAVLPEQVWQSELSELAYDVYALVHRDEIQAGEWPETLQAGFDPVKVAQRVSGRSKQPETDRWQIVQVGVNGEFAVRKKETDDGLQIITLAETESVKGLAPTLAFPPVEDRQRFLATEGEHYSSQGGLFRVETQSDFLEFDALEKPSWASKIWRDQSGLKVEIIFAGQAYIAEWQEGEARVRNHWQFPEPLGIDPEFMDLHDSEKGLYADLTIKNITQRFRWIEPGTFMMGSPEDEEGRWEDEDLHQVTLTKGFWLADTTVTQELWMAVMGENPSHFKNSPKKPVEQVSWDDCQQFIAKLNQQIPGLQAQLPTEAQWEYACRAGTPTPFLFGGKNDLTLEKVNYSGKWDDSGYEDKALQQTAAVKIYPANTWGLYEMHGNVWEWCRDVWQDNLGSEPVIDPVHEAEGGTAGVRRVMRGGSWLGDGRRCRSAIRLRDGPDYRYNLIGFRLSLGHAELRQGDGVAGSGVSVLQTGAASAAPDSTVAEQVQAGAVLDAGRLSATVKSLLGRFRAKDKK
ncbi:MAG: formylglycine-generating enzyme family protein [Thiolinea sp.]